MCLRFACIRDFVAFDILHNSHYRYLSRIERERDEDWIQAKCEQCRILDWRNSLLKDPVRISFFLNIEKLPLFQNPSTYKIHIFAVALLMPLLLSWILIYLFLLSLSVLAHSIFVSSFYISLQLSCFREGEKKFSFFIFDLLVLFCVIFVLFSCYYFCAFFPISSALSFDLLRTRFSSLSLFLSIELNSCVTLY